MPTNGIRRGRPDEPPEGAELGTLTVRRGLTPDERDSGTIEGTSINAASPATGRHRDRAEVPLVEKVPPRQPAPFKLKAREP